MDDITGLSKAELQELKIKIDSEIDAIRDQLKRVEATAASGGEYADPDWYWSAVRARKHKVRQSQMIQSEFTRRKEMRQGTIEGHFVDIARIRLSSDLFDELLDEARRRTP